mmetsp:Transcript_49744/g.131836  ORF Transcript_49744/g.131836 Transcript_49744/m.131836 type:complete len:232 (-) Transcript_49744:696-1391(-)
MSTQIQKNISSAAHLNQSQNTDWNGFASVYAFFRHLPRDGLSGSASGERPEVVTALRCALGLFASRSVNASSKSSFVEFNAQTTLAKSQPVISLKLSTALALFAAHSALMSPFSLRHASSSARPSPESAMPENRVCTRHAGYQKSDNDTRSPHCLGSSCFGTECRWLPKTSTSPSSKRIGCLSSRKIRLAPNENVALQKSCWCGAMKLRPSLYLLHSRYAPGSSMPNMSTI